MDRDINYQLKKFSSNIFNLLVDVIETTIFAKNMKPQVTLLKLGKWYIHLNRKQYKWMVKYVNTLTGKMFIQQKKRQK